VMAVAEGRGEVIVDATSPRNCWNEWNH
jgi:hypothetical protein